MKIDNFKELNEVLAEARMVVRDLSLSKGTTLYRKIMKLLILLVKMHSLTISVRADCIEELLSMNPNFPEDISLVKNSSQGNIIDFDRRRSKAERRNLLTYIANDRRSGIADRRKRIKKVVYG